MSGADLLMLNDWYSEGLVVRILDAEDRNYINQTGVIRAIKVIRVQLWSIVLKIQSPFFGAQRTIL